MELVPIAYIDQVTELPKIPPIRLETEPTALIFLIESSFWASLSLWLRNKVAGEALPPEAYQEPAIWVEPYAEYYTALFRLAVETHPRTTCPDLLRFPSPADLWLHCIKTTAQQCLNDSGLFGMPPCLVGKKESYEKTRRICQQLRKLSYDSQALPTVTEDLESLLIVEAQRVAQDPSQRRFRYRHFLPFIKILLDVARTAYECKQLQIPYILPSGELFITDKGMKLPKPKQRKGFEKNEKESWKYEKTLSTLTRK